MQAGDTVPVANGGTGATTAQAAINALTNAGSATNEYVLTKDTATGNAIFKLGGSSGGGGSIYKNAVADYGAVGNGVVNNATAFTNFATGLPSYIGYIPSGKFVVSGTTGVGAIHLNYSTGGMYAYDGSPVGSLFGAGPQNTIIVPDTVGMYGVQATSIPTASIMEVTYKDFCISGRNRIGTVNGLYLEVVEMCTMENLRFEQLNTGIYANSVEYATFRKCFFEGNVNGMIAELGAGGFTHLNATTFQDCLVDRNTSNGIRILDNASNVNFTGGSVANSGTMGVGGTAGLNFNFTGTEGANGCHIANCYFEANNGDADIKLTNTGSFPIVHTIQNCNFNRVSSTNYTTNNIKSVGKNIILLIGCSFRGYNTYAANAARSYLSGDANTIFIPIGCTWSHSVEAIGLPSMQTKGTYYGSVSVSGGAINVGASNIPVGWIVTYSAVGQYLITHNLNSATPIFMTQILDPGFVATSYIIGVTANTITVGMRNAANAYVDCSFMFTLDIPQVSSP
jgi:hypothetical protein